MSNERIVVVGFGWVGQANALALSYDNYDVSYFDTGEPQRHYNQYKDKYEKLKRLGNVLEKDGENTYYIVCVGDRVDADGNQDISSIKAALESVKNTKGKIVLRSTILPSYLKDLKFDIYLPEFLHEKAAVKESINPQYVVIGKRESATVPHFIDVWAKRSEKAMECSPEDASHVKYMSNLWNALRVAFTNEFGSSIVEPKDNKAVERIDKVINFLFENGPYKRYGKSFGGHCLPKDTRAYVKWCKDNGKENLLMDGLQESNNFHKEMEQKYPHLPEWYSNWPEQVGSGWVALHTLGQSIKRNIFNPITALKRKKTVEYKKFIKD